ncbi:unnamed protein product [Prorocentrum cordatum]|uniref:Uncharacterized protein n=1 Tax=Prorocentrum cordatum TaxID=2364126 RepID=A0ABN9QSJ2_9DINO|nr:unnamed protein product [Polarella glacialis]
MVRAVLKNSRGLAAPGASIYRAMHPDCDRQACKAMGVTAKIYMDEAKRLRRDRARELKGQWPVPDLRELGAPRPHLWLALLGGAVQPEERAGNVNCRALKQSAGAIKAAPTITDESLCL